MNQKKIDRSKFEVVSAAEIDVEQLDALYDEVFLHRSPFLKKNWAWYYNSAFFDHQIPLILRGPDRAVGASGMIPVRLKVGPEIKTASWYIDFAVSSDFQRKGLGTILTKKWMSFADMQITFCNDRSIGVFKKLGWTESFRTYLHICILNPFSIPAVARRIPTFLTKFLDFIFRPIFIFLHKKNAAAKSDWKVQSLNKKNLDEFYAAFLSADKVNNKKGTIEVHRDKDFVSWRLLNSPDRANYYVFQIPGISAIFAQKANHQKYIDLLWVSDLNNPELVKKLLSSLSLYGINKGCSYLRLYTSDENLSAYLKKGIPGKVRNVRFAYFSKDESLYTKMKAASWNWQLIDSDFEKLL